VTTGRTSCVGPLTGLRECRGAYYAQSSPLRIRQRFYTLDPCYVRHPGKKARQG